MDAGTHAVGGAEFRHPHEHVDAQFLRPGQVDLIDQRIEERDAERIALHYGDENQQRRGRDQARDQNFFKSVKNTKKHFRLKRKGWSILKPRGRQS